MDAVASIFAAHPRGCGADGLVCCLVVCSVGSSPRVRGRYLLPVGDGDGERLIPAGAGQIHHSFRASYLKSAHPRGCGADSEEGVVLCCEWGSSPRVRGRLAPWFPVLGCGRLIPAGAGQIQYWGHQFRPPPAHPRGCGADCGWVRSACQSYGSSPRVRGRSGSLSSRRLLLRLIPAGAGQIQGILLVQGQFRGSSPRVRGRSDRGYTGELNARLIPAGAGQIP